MVESSRDRTKRELLEVAERMIATRGVDVPLREIAVAAGHRNNSAIAYHFGDREGLLRAIVQMRLVPMELRRKELLDDCIARGAENDLHELMKMFALPILEVTGTHYARFLEVSRAMLPQYPIAAGETVWATVLGLIDKQLPGDRDTRKRRIGATATVMFALIADYERANAERASNALSHKEIIDLIVAVISAEI